MARIETLCRLLLSCCMRFFNIFNHFFIFLIIFFHFNKICFKKHNLHFFFIIKFLHIFLIRLFEMKIFLLIFTFLNTKITQNYHFFQFNFFIKISFFQIIFFQSFHF